MKDTLKNTDSLNFPADKPMCDSPLWKYCEENKPKRFIKAIAGLLGVDVRDLKHLRLTDSQIDVSRCIYEHFWWTKHHN